MEICSVCRKPQNQCACTPETKAKWEHQMELYREHEKERIQYVFRNQPDEIPKRMEMLKRRPTYEQCHCFDIDDDIWPIIELLWQKGYGTRYCCAGHAERKMYSMYIMFDLPYFFDFTTEDFGEGWSYTRTKHQALYFSVTSRLMRQLKKTGEDPGEYLEKQRRKLFDFVKKLPQALVVSASLRLPGTSAGGKIIKIQEENHHDNKK